MNHIIADTASGNDAAYIVQAKADDVYVDTGDGADKLWMSDVNAVGDLFAHLGAGDDDFSIENSGALTPFFHGGPGFDTIYDQPNAFDEVLASVDFELVI